MKSASPFHVQTTSVHMHFAFSGPASSNPSPQIQKQELSLSVLRLQKAKPCSISLAKSGHFFDQDSDSPGEAISARWGKLFDVFLKNYLIIKLVLIYKSDI